MNQIFYSDDEDVWYFWDDDYKYKIGPYESESDAKEAFKLYSES